jgi:hypothetical protein
LIIIIITIMSNFMYVFYSLSRTLTHVHILTHNIHTQHIYTYVHIHSNIIYIYCILNIVY